MHDPPSPALNEQTMNIDHAISQKTSTLTVLEKEKCVPTNKSWDNYFIFAAATIGLKELNFQPKPKE